MNAGCVLPLPTPPTSEISGRAQAVSFCAVRYWYHYPGSDILKEKPEIGIYVEVEASSAFCQLLLPLLRVCASQCCECRVRSTAEVSANADNLSLAVVDFENGGRSSPRPSNRVKYIKPAGR